MGPILLHLVLPTGWIKRAAVAPGSATGAFQGSQSLLIGCVQSSTPALLQMMSDFTQYADA